MPTVHQFVVRRGQTNPTAEQWGAVRGELKAWYPECRLESEVIDGEMGPFGICIASRVSICLIDGPESVEAATVLMRRALELAGRADLLET